MRYYTRTEGDMGGNATVVLTGHGFADLDHDIGPFTSEVVCTLADSRPVMDVQIVCPCPAKDGAPRHVSDTVTLRETLDFRAATTIRNSIAFAKAEDPDLSSAEMLAILTEGYLLFGIEAWSLTDEKNKAVPATKPEIRQAAGRSAPRRTDRGGGGHPVPAGDPRPFSPTGVDLIAAFVDGRVDVSEEGWGAQEPDAVEAILDFHYPDGRHRGDYWLARWRLQVISEYGYGHLARQEAAVENSKVTKLRRVR